jgi:polyisoprenoid-binding protein YceI
VEHALRPVEQPNSALPNNLIKIALIAVITAATLLAGAIGYFWFSGGSGQASAVISAPELALRPGDTRTLFSITADESQVRFIIDETLLGNPKTVVGVTNQVAGEILVDFSNPTNSQLGAIRINVRTLETDNEIRTRALRGQILQADEEAFEFATFVPTQVVGLPNSVTIGETFSFEIHGQLTVHGVTRNITFEATLTPISTTRLAGTAQTTVRYADFNITIPTAPGVANVSDDVRLEIDFTALAN